MKTGEKATMFVLKVYLEELMQVADDVKKTIVFDKSSGTWAWHDRDEADIPEAWHTGFHTFLEAAKNATEPFMEGWGS